jgi:very-short-patch-repair endonuclease
MVVNSTVRELLAAHDGVITRAQAMTAGLSSSAIGRLRSSGEWRAVATGVYVAGDHAVTDRARMRIACSSVGPGAALGGLASVWWQGKVDRPPTRPMVVAPRGRQGRAVSGATVVHRDLHDTDLVERHRLRVVALPLALLEAATVEDSLDVLDRALVRKQVSLEDVVAAHERYPGRRGATAAGRILAAAAGGARSEAERLLHRLMRRSSIGGWDANGDAAGYVCDVVFEAARVVVEVDGFAFHTDPDAFQRDREKRNVLVAAGWTVLHFTWRDLTERPGYVVASIRHAIRRDGSR